MPCRLIPGIVTVAVAVLLVLLFHHTLFLSHFDRVIGDNADGRFNLAILEHWWRLIQGLDPWRSFNFFYPATGTLGYSDALVLLTPPYILARLAGGSDFQALQVTLVTMTVVGFAGTLLFLRGQLRLALPVALAGAFAFAGNTVLYQSLGSGHTQLVASLWVPWIACLVAWTLRALPRRRGLVPAGVAGVLIAALLYTSFNTGWFVVMQLLIVAVLVAGATVVRWRGEAVRVAAGALVRHGWQCVVFLGALAASLVPFLLTYLPVVRATGGRSYDEVAASLPLPEDLIHPVANLVWHPVAVALFPVLGGRAGELGKGLTWGLLAVFAATLVWLAPALLLRGPAGTGWAPGAGLTRFQRQTAGFLGLSVLICWVLMLNVDHYTLWPLVYHFVPGAVGVRAVFRFNLVLIFSVITVAAIGLHRLWTDEARGYRRYLALLLCLVIAAEQSNTFKNYLGYRQHLAWLDALPPPPAACRSFAVLPGASETDQLAVAWQMDAVRIAQHDNLPTVNGYSGMSPPSWELVEPGDTVGYATGLMAWADRYRLWPGLCAVDIGRRLWSPLTRAGLIDRADLYIRPGARLGFTRGDSSGTRFLKPGQTWGEAGPEGTWTIARSSRFEGVLVGWPPGGLDLEILGSSFVTPEWPSQRVAVAVNGTVIGRIVYRMAEPAPSLHRIAVPAAVLGRSGEFTLDFLSDDARSPRSLGVSSDTRDLGLLLVRLSFLPEPQ